MSPPLPDTWTGTFPLYKKSQIDIENETWAVTA